VTADLSPARSVDEVIVSPVEAPAQRSAAAERDAFLSLSDALARQPETAVQRLVEVAMRLTNSQAAGVSLEELDGPEPVFRWVAVTGQFERYLNGTMPRHFSPCGTVLSRSTTLVMRDPIRFFPYLSQLHTPVRTVLLVPFPARGRLVGTLWVLRTQPGEPYSVEDVRAVESLTTFSTSLLDALSARRSRFEPS
jgi:GAF domain-containing protein